MTHCSTQRLSLAIVGNAGGTNVGESLRRAALSLGCEVLFFDCYRAWRGNRVQRVLSWRLNDKRPPRFDEFVDDVLATCRRTRPQILITTGIAPLTAAALHALRRLEIFCLNYSTDDPWNPGQTANWFFRALPLYDLILTTRRANIGDFRRIGCRDVRYLPFGYDDELFGGSTSSVPSAAHDLLFVGGADKERASFMSEFMSIGPAVALVGDYWRRTRHLRRFAAGHKTPDVVRSMTAAAKINLCLVRRANRDGHVMRSFEIAAMGGCMLAEDTEEHREIFGQDGEAVVYFRTPQEAAQRARLLLVDPAERARLSAALRALILPGGHTYRDRLLSMLRSVPVDTAWAASVTGC